MGLATFWAIFSQTQMVTLSTHDEDEPMQGLLAISKLSGSFINRGSEVEAVKKSS
jgi:hypothetical protein